ncbi:Ubiquitin E2 variant 1D-4 [Hibiscus syriacus]|uniref:Ubiquitin E2 variant 1D-4 n=1 Tax=Hibiscus syriacus TaxID=106335 RepID=A0A6A3A915_HIBSY|nr:Ubiquitin E2 variant 1D-4 [Hibiscus syriacus]
MHIFFKMSLYIGHLSSPTRRHELEHVFERFGRCNVTLKDGYGFVVYDYPPNAQKALRALQGRNICGKPLTLTWSNKQPRPFKRISRADQTYDHCKMSIEQPECHGIGLNSADLLNADIDYHQDHVKQFIREDIHDCSEYLLNEDGQDEPNQMDDMWDGQCHGHSNGNDIEHEREFDHSVGYDRKADNDNCQIVYSSGCHAEQNPQERITTELIGEETLNHPKIQNCCKLVTAAVPWVTKSLTVPMKLLQEDNPRHDDDIGRGGRVKGVLASFGSSSLAKLQQDHDPQRAKRFKDSRKASGSGGKSGRLIENGSSFIGKETYKARENDSEEKKRSRRGGTPQSHNAKKARSFSSLLHPDCSASRAHSKSKSITRMPRSSLKSRSRSISSRARSPSTNLRPLASFSDKGQFNLKGSLDKANTLESKDIMVGGDLQLEIAKFENRVSPATIENAGSSAKVESEVEKDQAMQGGNYDNHMIPRSAPRAKNPSTLSEKSAPADESLSLENMREIKGRQDFDALTTDTSVRSRIILPEELCMVMKHYGLEPPNENERHLSTEAYFGAARL